MCINISQDGKLTDCPEEWQAANSLGIKQRGNNTFTDYINKHINDKRGDHGRTARGHGASRR